MRAEAMATTQEKISSTSELAPGDLPDPLDLPAKSPASGDADEIISQLAANQIDKMLADGNIEPVEATALRESGESVLTDMNLAETTAEEFSRIISDEPASFDQAPQAGAIPAAEQAMADVQSAAEELARELEADEARPVRGLKSESTKPVQHDASPAVGVRVGFGILNAINAPFKNLSDNTRELLGSLAIITLVNALSILLYVMIYR